MTEEAEERTAITSGPVPDVVARGLPSVLVRTGRLLGGGLTAAALPVVACSAVLQFVLVVAGVLIAAGRLLDRPVTARSAAGTVIRRAPALAASVPLTGGALPAVPAAGAGSGNRVEAAALPGGAVVVAAWQYDTASLGEAPDKVPDTLPILLRLIRCTPDGCPPMSSAPGTARVGRAGPYELNGAAIAVTTGSRIVVAAIMPETDRDDRSLRILRCARLPCGRPEVLATLRTPYISGGSDRPVAIATGRSGRPVIAMQDVLHGGLTVVSCDDADCDRPRTARFGRREHSGIQEDDRFDAARRLTRRLHFLAPDAVEVAIPPDDRPIVTYRNMVTGAATLLRCRTPDCASAGTTVLGPPGLAQHAPALDLALDGRPLIAVHDLTNASVTLLACHDPGCVHRDRARIGTYRGVPGPLDLAVGGDGRPRVLWVAGSDDPRYELHLTTCRRAGCAGGVGR